MTHTATAIVTVQPDELGGPGAPSASQAASRVIQLLGEAAGEGMRLASLSIDITSHPLEDRPVDIAVRIDKRARSIIFASAEARAGGLLVFSAQGLFSRES